MASIKVTEDNSEQIMSELDASIERILEIIGIKAEKYAKARCPVGTPESTGKKGYRGGTLRNSITHQINKDENGGSVSIGSNIEYAPFVELGTGPYFETPPEWETFTTIKGTGVNKGGYVHPRPYLKPAIEDHLKEYVDIMKKELGGT